MERGETDVLHFLFAKDEALIGRGVRLRDISSGHRGSRCTPEQRKTQSGRTHHRHGGDLGCAFLPRSSLDPSHGRILSCDLVSWSTVPEPLERKGVMGIKPTIAQGTRSGRRARLVSRELAKARIAPGSSLQTVTGAPVPVLGRATPELSPGTGRS